MSTTAPSICRSAPRSRSGWWHAASTTSPLTGWPRVVDISHHNTVTDLRATAAAGIWGVIHKSSQGRGYRDPDYAARRPRRKAAGLLWGAYHFNDGSTSPRRSTGSSSARAG
jgi:GH25 family lysozyme M1 (1,4-beta-N-acetylmuramidase)